MLKPEKHVPREGPVQGCPTSRPSPAEPCPPLFLLPRVSLSRGTRNCSAQWKQFVLDAGIPLSPHYSSGSTEGDGGRQDVAEAATEACPVGSFVVCHPYSPPHCTLSPGWLWALVLAAGDSEAQGVLCESQDLNPGHLLLPVRPPASALSASDQIRTDSEDPERGWGRGSVVCCKMFPRNASSSAEDPEDLCPQL